MRKVLFIGGSINQTSQMHQIARELPEFQPYFTPYYADKGLEKFLTKMGLTRTTVLGEKLVNRCRTYLQDHRLNIDFGGESHDYDLVFTGSDVVIQENIRHLPIVLVQEGMTDPENWLYHLYKSMPFLPRWTAGTATNGLSDAYRYFCVASEGYRDLFISKGVQPEKIRVTGIPNFDNCQRYYDNDFPHRDFVLVCTSDARETFKFENRRRFIDRAVEIAAGRQLIFKLHPNENFARSTAEINRWAPGALVYTSGSAEEMIANCQVLITAYSTTVYVGLALGKEVYSDIDLEDLKRLTPLQNGNAARQIAEVGRELLNPVHAQAC